VAGYLVASSYSSHAAPIAPPPLLLHDRSGGYGYSRTHGAQMHGLGAGVPVARVLAHFLGGSAQWETSCFELHTTVEIRLPKHGFVF
jgi:hypothetical protein